MNISTIKNINNLEKLRGEQNTLILNFGFGKCGSTSLQSMVLPFLPLKNYTYEGRHYKLLVDSSLNIINFKPIEIKQTLFNHIYEPDILVEKISQLFNGKTNHIACLSNELLPTSPEQVSKLIHLVKKSCSGLKLIYLFSIRDIIPMVISGYSHGCLQHLEVEGYAYSINEVIFETFKDAYKEGYSIESLFTAGGKRPIIIENYYLAKIIEELNTSISDTFIINVNSLFKNQQIWFELLLNITKSFDDSYSIARQWVESLEKLGPVNRKTIVAKSKIEESKRTLNLINSQRLRQVDILNKEKYSKLGHYWD
ncbi:hypothetical protein [Synechococcus sp. CC9616]|uniref:hypothetical protein n=1 Tax=Synechococcus sp. CC9616 TaxID=110663 RepID=UPI0004911642|nr:hypothetical protein [Synechococcus sp. CC9616]